MNTLVCTNPECGKSFDSKRTDAKFCSDNCRKQVARSNSDSMPVVNKEDSVATCTGISDDGFMSLIRRFNKMVENSPTPSSINAKLLQLREDTINNIHLNWRQADAIIGRINNYLNGTYGVDDTKVEYMKHNKAV